MATNTQQANTENGSRNHPTWLANKIDKTKN